MRGLQAAIDASYVPSAGGGGEELPGIVEREVNGGDPAKGNGPRKNRRPENESRRVKERRRPGHPFRSKIIEKIRRGDRGEKIHAKVQ